MSSKELDSLMMQADIANQEAKEGGNMSNEHRKHMTIKIHIGRGYHPKWWTWPGSPDQAWFVFDDPHGGERYSQYDKGEWVTGMGWPMDPNLVAVAERWLAQYDKDNTVAGEGRKEA